MSEVNMNKPFGKEADEFFEWSQALAGEDQERFAQLMKAKRFSEISEWFLREKVQALTNWLDAGYYFKKA